MFKDFSISALIAGFVSVLVGFSSSIAVIFQATQALGATQAQTASWLWAIGIGMALPTLALTLASRKPILIAWSTPGAAVIGAAAAAGHLTMPQAIGTFLFSAILITLAGFSGAFERVMNRLPLPLASALLAGVLARFALDAVIITPTNPLLVSAMAVAYAFGRRFWPKANIPLVLLLGIAIAFAQQRVNLTGVPWSLTLPVWTTPEWSLAACLGVGLPLFIVTMASQNLPGIAAIRAGGYEAPISKIIGWTGVSTLIFAPFGGFALNLAAITAAFCVGPQAHPDPSRRYWAPLCAAGFYLLLGLFGATVAALFSAFPRELVLAIAGLALLSTIANALSSALHETRFREAAALTFLVTLSGLTLLGIGSAFWGVLTGGLFAAIQTFRKKPDPAPRN